MAHRISIEAFVDVTAIDSTEDIVTILDAGARKVFVKSAQLEALSKFAERVIPLVEVQDISSTAKYPMACTLHLEIPRNS